MIPPGALDLLLPQPNAIDLTFRWATVTSTDPLRVRLDGEDAPLPITPDTLLSPAALPIGKRVRVEIANRRIVVHGAAGSGALAHAVRLGANVHLDTVVEPGAYLQSSNAATSIALGYPEASAGLLEVLTDSPTSGMKWHRYSLYNSGTTTRRIYQRSYYISSGWSAWAIIYDPTTTLRTVTGSVTLATIATNTFVDVTLNYSGAGFTSAPFITLTPRSSRLTAALEPSATYTATTAVVRVANWSPAATGATYLMWAATGN